MAPWVNSSSSSSSNSDEKSFQRLQVSGVEKEYGSGWLAGCGSAQGTALRRQRGELEANLGQMILDHSRKCGEACHNS